ncbi:MAG TPA: 5-formyltetrahydrofolate cyclo-ligase [Tahibacter sp.]|nr:5-formyltetrahydrofolate cyclo-ligase [Tahibacter sp.]
MTDVHADRRALRESMKQQRRALSAAERIAAAQGVMTQLAQLPEITVDTRIGAYFAVDGELSLHLVVAQCWRRGQSMHLPLALARRQLAYAPYAAQTAVAPNRFGIPEPVVDASVHVAPASLELVLVPLVAFTRNGHRLGYGGGFYDSSFAFLHERERPTTPLLVGVGYAFQEAATLAPESWDVRLDFVATDRELIDCSATE